MLFDPGAELLLAFGGDATLESPYLTLDILDYDADKGVYAGHALHFDPTGARAPELERNAPLCLQCHATFMGVEPVRRAYVGGVFPGIYGSIAAYAAPSGAGDAFESPRERQAFRDFLDGEKSRYRYQFLQTVAEG